MSGKEESKRLTIRMGSVELEELDEALKITGYGSRAEWIRQKKRELLKEAERVQKKRAK
jgi:metal-responsive CopG/Arc/MetJ family transcriptional regulator